MDKDERFQLDLDEDYEICGDCGHRFYVPASGYEDTSKCGRCWDKINQATMYAAKCKCGETTEPVARRPMVGKSYQNHADTSHDGKDHSDYEIVEVPA